MTDTPNEVSYELSAKTALECDECHQSIPKERKFITTVSQPDGKGGWGRHTVRHIMCTPFEVKAFAHGRKHNATEITIQRARESK